MTTNTIQSHFPHSLFYSDLSCRFSFASSLWFFFSKFNTDNKQSEKIVTHIRLYAIWLHFSVCHRWLFRTVWISEKLSVFSSINFSTTLNEIQQLFYFIFNFTTISLRIFSSFCSLFRQFFLKKILINFCIIFVCCLTVAFE